MSEPLVRLLSLEIRNLKNVVYGNVSLTGSQEENGFSEKADIAGIYGQNGSGKTTIIQALNLLKHVASGFSFWKDMADCISVTSDKCDLSFKFAIRSASGNKFIATYSCSILKYAADQNGPCFSSESLSVSKETDGSWSKTVPYFEYEYPNNDIQVFSPKTRYENIIAGDQQKVIGLSVAYKIAQQNNSSFLFSRTFCDILKDSPETELFEIVQTLKNYALKQLFVIQSSHSAFISIDAVIPLSVSHSSPEYTAIGDIPINQAEPMVYDEKTFHIIQSILKEMDCVIGALVPGLSIKTKDYGKQLQKNGTEGIRFELVSEHNGIQIPIRYESEGIRKIISILNLIILMYNNSSVLIAVDELDAGIFEILLGELIHVIEESGKGQLIFTSHNLRPLEVINKANVIFTTTNSKNRYIRLKNVRPTNNLRDCYIRALNLGGQDEELAVQAKTAAIRRALRKAGEHGES
jgi:AAA15 family ATPase/GTPase